MWIVALIVLVAVLVAVLFKVLSPKSAPETTAVADESESLIATQIIVTEIPFETPELQNVANECYRLAFALPKINPSLIDDHAAVIDAVAKSLDESVHERDYFPRRPMLLPKLLQTLNDDQSTRDELVRVLLEDPTLAGAVLQRANSAAYRISPEPIESLDRAVFLLGTNGLRSLAAAAILQPVFRMPRGQFESFPDFTWEQAERTAIAAEVHARSIGDAEPIVAQLLGLISMLGNIVLFRLTMDKYRDFPMFTPRAEVFIETIRTQRACTSSLIAQAWGLSDLSIAAFTEQQQKMPPSHMSSLGRAVYFGDLTGALAMLTARGYYSKTQAHELLTTQGADAETARGIWLAAASAAQV